MSRKGKLPVALPKGVEVSSKGNVVTVKGPKATLTQEVKDGVKVEVKDGEVVVSLVNDNKEDAKFHGLYRQLVENMVIGVSQGFEKKLEMIGVGFRAAMKGADLDLQLGFSHPTALKVPEGIKVDIEKNTKITVSGADKQRVGQFAADIRSLRPPEPYKGKGVRYADEHVRRKAGKSGKAK